MQHRSPSQKLNSECCGYVLLTLTIRPPGCPNARSALFCHIIIILVIISISISIIRIVIIIVILLS